MLLSKAITLKGYIISIRSQWSTYRIGPHFEQIDHHCFQSYKAAALAVYWRIKYKILLLLGITAQVVANLNQIKQSTCQHG